MKRKQRTIEQVKKEREKEIRVVYGMIALYCHKNHHKNHNDDLCGDCEKLYEYAKIRTENCPFMRTKTFCNQCAVHCYAPAMRVRIKEVMRYSGPRMMLYHPLLCMWHVITTISAKIDMKKESSS